MRRECVVAGTGQRQQAQATVGWRRDAGKQAVALETLQDAAEVAGIEVQLAAELRCRDARALGEFVEHTRLSEREPAVQEAVLQDADDACVEAAEPPDRGDAAFQRSGS